MSEKSVNGAAPTESAKPKPRAALGPGRFKEADYQRRTFAATAEAGTTVEEMLEPKYWANHAPMVTPCSRIDCITEDMTLFVEFLVLSCDRNWVQVHVLAKHELIPAHLRVMPAVSDEYRVEHAGLHHKWRVVRRSDSAAIKTGCQTKDEADTWLRGHIKTAG